jgi:hypothetical protein
MREAFGAFHGTLRSRMEKVIGYTASHLTEETKGNARITLPPHFL